MKKFLTPALIAFTVLSGVLSSQASASHAEYDLVCVHNDTDRTVNFSYLGDTDDDWTSSSVRPNGVSKIYWSTAYSDHYLTLRFDADMSNRTRMVEYTLYPDAAVDVDCDYYGSDYRFKWRSGNTIDLYDDN